ncbi:DUF924 family protein [Sphingomonas sp. M1-B02]|uniref:DUF924 family protein n=1 Tax=Sphingomonas sp. M1-B02 TaxID=3114300 RepID=UPI00223F2084|nr:DUF924 family protein [Sphingomonas sp. S6-11]UZK67184.1 DUF924 domain-containing protein [Sphingomonas sp. S6-11]
MRDDLGTPGSDVHAEAERVLAFWFDMLMPEQWFSRASGVDQEIRDRFATLREEVLANDAAGWREDRRTLLAAILLLDQFSRNIHRRSSEAFAADALARELTLQAIDKGWDEGLSREQAQFLYMPLMHAEDIECQALSLAKFALLGDEKVQAFAREHFQVIERFGRFPTRNEALGRQSTAAEKDYLSQPGVGW